MPGRLEPISELQRLTVSLRGGFAQKDRCLVLFFTGKLDAYSENCFSEYASDVLKANKLPVLFDLSKIDLVDSSGLGALVQLAKQFTDAKRAFQLVGNTRVAKTIKLARLAEFLHLVNDVPTALTNLSA